MEKKTETQKVRKIRMLGVPMRPGRRLPEVIKAAKLGTETIAEGIVPGTYSPRNSGVNPATNPRTNKLDYLKMAKSSIDAEKIAKRMDINSNANETKSTENGGKD